MTNDVNNLPSDPEALQEMVLSLQLQVKDLIEKKQHLMEQFRLAQQQRFGASSEAHPAQGDLFNEAEVELDVVEEEETSTTTVVKKKPVRNKLPKDFPKTYHAKPLFMILKIKTVRAVVMNYIKWAMSAVKSLSLFPHKSKSLNMFV